MWHDWWFISWELLKTSAFLVQLLVSSSPQNTSIKHIYCGSVILHFKYKEWNTEEEKKKLWHWGKSRRDLEFVALAGLLSMLTEGL